MTKEYFQQKYTCLSDINALKKYQRWLCYDSIQ